MAWGLFEKLFKRKKKEKQDNTIDYLVLMDFLEKNPENNLPCLNLKSYELIGDKFVSKIKENYSLKPRKVIVPTEDIFNIGLGKGHNINLERYIGQESTESLHSLMQKYGKEDVCDLKIDSQGNIHLENSLVNVLLHDKNGCPVTCPRYNGGIETGYAVKKGNDNVYGKVEFFTNTQSLRDVCYSKSTEKEGGSYVAPFENRQIIMPGDFISLIVPGEKGWDTIEEGGRVIAVFATNYYPKEK